MILDSIVRWEHLPYGMTKGTGSIWTVFNHRYRSLGTVEGDKLSLGNKLGIGLGKRFNQTVFAALDYLGQGTDDCIYFYDDGCVPDHSVAKMRAYMERMQILGPLKSMPTLETAKC